MDLKRISKRYQVDMQSTRSYHLGTSKENTLEILVFSRYNFQLLHSRNSLEKAVNDDKTIFKFGNKPITTTQIPTNKKLPKEIFSLLYCNVYKN